VRVAIIGAGIYGAYIADTLSNDKKCLIDLYEKKNQILTETAQKNQYRLHIGYHYPRSKETILQTINGYKIFKKKFRNFLYFPKKNYYLVHKNSLINFNKYLNVCKNFSLKFKEIGNKKYLKYIHPNKIEGGINTEEGVILIDKFIPYLRKKLKKKINIVCGIEIDNIDNIKGLIYSKGKVLNQYDIIINATYVNPNLGLKKKKFKLKYELTGMVKIKNPFKEQLGLTIMDGQFCSLYPQNKNYSTLSSVKYTPIFKSSNFEKIREKINKINKINKKKIKNNIIHHVSKYIKINKNIKSELILGHKVKLKNDNNDIRTTSIIVENKLISILCGKIDAAPLIYNMIEKIINKVKS
jgi:hypothetical protein